VFVLHIAFKTKPGMENAVVTTFFDPFTTALSRQAGFLSTDLLHDEASGERVVTIAFENQLLQQRWAKSELHDEVWGMLKACCSEYSVKRYSAMQRLR
jgi:heme-degrading monooxygenase HmoA